MKANRRGKNAPLYAYFNQAHAILRLYSICFKIEYLNKINPFFRALYFVLRTRNQAIPFEVDYSLLSGKTFNEQIIKIEGIVKRAAWVLGLRDEYKSVDRWFTKIKRTLEPGKQTLLDAFLK